MKWDVNFECGFDEGDGDYCKESGQMYHPTKGGYWVVDDTSKEDMKLLALFDHAVYEEFGGEDESKDYGDIDDDTIKANLKKDKFLKKIGVTDEEIDAFVEKYSIYDYFPSNHHDSDCRHDHWFEIKISPSCGGEHYVDENFLSRPWATGLKGTKLSTIKDMLAESGFEHADADLSIAYCIGYGTGKCWNDEGIVKFINEVAESVDFLDGNAVLGYITNKECDKNATEVRQQGLI